jgi:hypothetical protein
MRQQNHASPKRGIAKMKSQGSAPEAHKSLQSQNSPSAGNRLSVNALNVVHGRLSARAFNKSSDKNIQHTVRYTELSPDRFKDFWR